MRFRCPFCFYAINADESTRGYSMTCPSCAKTVKVPVGRFEDGCIIGDFLIKSKIGEGSIGAVYLATQLSLERQVALKILSPEYIEFEQSSNQRTREKLRYAVAILQTVS